MKISHNLQQIRKKVNEEVIKRHAEVLLGVSLFFDKTAIIRKRIEILKEIYRHDKEDYITVELVSIHHQSSGKWFKYSIINHSYPPEAGEMHPLVTRTPYHCYEWEEQSVPQYSTYLHLSSSYLESPLSLEFFEFDYVFGSCRYGDDCQGFKTGDCYSCYQVEKS